jgi:hypothetical protein
MNDVTGISIPPVFILLRSTLFIVGRSRRFDGLCLEFRDLYQHMQVVILLITFDTWICIQAVRIDLDEKSRCENHSRLVFSNQMKTACEKGNDVIITAKPNIEVTFSLASS